MRNETYVIMVQTDEDDMFITESALAEIGSNIPVKFAASLEELEQVGIESGLPSVVLLNDRGAVSKGTQLLKRIRANEEYSHIPVVLLGEVTTSDHVRECYRLGANTYIVKPSSIAETKSKIETFFRYWFDVAQVE